MYAFFDSQGNVIHVKDMAKNIDVDDGHTDGHEGNVYHGHKDVHTDTSTWSGVVSRVTIEGSNVRP